MGRKLEFDLLTYQDKIDTTYCVLCAKLWAHKFEEPKCVCHVAVYWDADHNVFVLNVENWNFYSYYYCADYCREAFWTTQQLPFYGFLMETSPAWVDFP